MRILAILLVALLLVGCTAQPAPTTEPTSHSVPLAQGDDNEELPIGQTQGEQFEVSVPDEDQAEAEVDFSDLLTPEESEKSENEERSEEMTDAPQANKPEVILPEETLPQESEGSNPEVEADGYNSQIIQP